MKNTMQNFFNARAILEDAHDQAISDLRDLLARKPMTYKDICRTLDLPYTDENSRRSTEANSILGILSRYHCFHKADFATSETWQRTLPDGTIKYRVIRDYFTVWYAGEKDPDIIEEAERRYNAHEVIHYCLPY